MKTIYLNCLVLLLASCAGESQISKHLRFEDGVSPVYILEKFAFSEARLIDLGEHGIYIIPAYLLSESKGLEELLDNKVSFRYFDQEHNILGSYVKEFLFKHDISYSNHNNIYSRLYESGLPFDKITNLRDSIWGIPVYEFSCQPKTFVLLAVSDESKFSYGVDIDREQYDDDDILLIGDVKDLWVYSKDYVLMVAPIFRKGDIKKIITKKSP